MKFHDDEPQIDDVRWQAQEKARSLDPAADPAELRIARALRRAPPVDLPSGAIVYWEYRGMEIEAEIFGTSMT